MDSDSDSSSSDYVVDYFVRPDKVRASVNDESADILGNFDDSKRTEEWNTNITENGHVQMPSHNTVEAAMGDPSDDENNENDDSDDTEPSTANGSKKQLSEDQVANLLRGAKSNRHVLYVTNLNFETTKDDLQLYFSQVGEVKGIRIPPKRRGGFAFVEMQTIEGLRRALALHNTELQGRNIKVQISEGGKKKSANKKNILKQKNRKLAEMRNESKCFTKSGKYYDKTLKKEKMKEAMLRKRWRKPKKLS